MAEGDLDDLDGGNERGEEELEGTVIMVNGPASRGSSWIGFIPGLSSDVVTIALGVTGIIAWNLVGRPPAREA